MRDGRMHQTTVRFGPDLWEALEAECSRLGMSAAQYIRESALARLAYAAGQRPGEDHGEAVEAMVAPGAASTPGDRAARSAEEQLAQAQLRTEDSTLEASAVLAQSSQVRARSAAIREESARLRRGRLAATGGGEAK
jgi:hypothetical protein